jgi:hypothetical protein
MANADEDSGGSSVVKIISAVLAALAALATIIFGWPSYCRYMEWCSTLELSGQLANLNLGQSETITLIRRWDSGRSESVRDLDCTWSYSPSFRDLPSGRECSVTITALPDYFASDPTRTINLKINLSAFHVSGGNKSLEKELSATTVLHYLATPHIDVAENPVTPASTVKVGVTFPQAGRPSTYMCRWTPADRFINPGQCDATYQVETDFGLDRAARRRITVEVYGPDGGTIGTDTKEITIRIPPANFAIYVMDATLNTLQKDPTGQPLFTAIKSDLLGNAIKWKDGIDYFGGVAFGGPIRSSAQGGRGDCERISRFYPLARFNFKRLQGEVEQIRPDGKQLPLIDAIISALDQYQPFRGQGKTRPEDRFVLSIITTGPDTCEKADPKYFIDALTSRLSERELREIYYDNRLLPIMLRLAAPGDLEAAALRSTQLYSSPEQPLAILIVQNPNILSEAISAIAELSSPDVSTRRHGCGTLQKLFIDQNDPSGAAKVQRKCAIA